MLTKKKLFQRVMANAQFVGKTQMRRVLSLKLELNFTLKYYFANRNLNEFFWQTNRRDFQSHTKKLPNLISEFPEYEECDARDV